MRVGPGNVSFKGDGFYKKRVCRRSDNTVKEVQTRNFYGIVSPEETDRESKGNETKLEKVL